MSALVPRRPSFTSSENVPPIGRASPVEPNSAPLSLKAKLRKRGSSTEPRVGSFSLGSNRGGASDDSDGSGLSNDAPAAGISKKRVSGRSRSAVPVRTRPIFAEKEDTRFEDFQLSKVIGQGSFGVVLLGTKQYGLAAGQHFALKVVSKTVLKEAGIRMQRRLWTERNILVSMDHKNIVRLQFAFQTPSNVYLAFDVYNGGSLHYHIYRPCKPAMANSQQVKKGSLGFNDETVAFYAGEILLAIAYMHKKGILHRDLKPGNIVIDAGGHARVIDFGCSMDAKINLDSTNERDFRGAKTLCGTNEYIAPEIFAGQAYGKSADWWAYGVLVHEMSIACMPFSIDKEKSRRDQSNELRLQLPIEKRTNMMDNFSGPATNLLSRLLQPEPNKRLGATARGSETIKTCIFFENMDWAKLEQHKLPPPFIPPTAQDDCKFISRKYKKMTVEGVLDETATNDDASLKKVFRNFEYQNEMVRHYDYTPKVPVSSQSGLWADADGQGSTLGTSHTGLGGSSGAESRGAAAVDEQAELNLGLDREYPMDPLLEEIEAPRPRSEKKDDGWGDWVVEMLFCCGNT